MDECRNFAHNLEAIRRLHNASMAEFSEELDIPRSTLQDVLKDGNASLHTALHIAGQLKVPLSALTGKVIVMKNLDALSVLLNCFEWFAFLPAEDQKTITAHIHAIMDVLEK